MQNPYEILDVSVDATDDEIKHQYHKLAKKYHPDLNQNDASALDKFKDISWAYDILTSPLERRKIDKKLGLDKSPKPVKLSEKKPVKESNIQDAEFSEINRRKDISSFKDGMFFTHDQNNDIVLQKRYLKTFILLFLCVLSLVLIMFIGYSLINSKQHYPEAVNFELNPVAYFKRGSAIKKDKVPQKYYDAESDLWYRYSEGMANKLNSLAHCSIAKSEDINKENRQFLRYNEKDDLWYLCKKPNSNKKPNNKTNKAK